MIEKVTAYKDREGNLHLTPEEAEAADFKAAFDELWDKAFDHADGRPSYGSLEAKWFVWRNRMEVHDLLAKIDAIAPENALVLEHLAKADL